MSTEQRVMVGGRRPLSEAAGRGGAPKPEETPEPPAKKGKKKLVLIGGVVALLAVAAAAWFLFLKPAPAEAAEPEPEPVVLGEVVPVDSVSLNLANGRYLRLGFALQLSADVKEEVNTARAVDQAIALFSGRDIAEVSDPAVRDQLVTELTHELSETYEGEVLDVYLTEYVTQ
jgi:flagellar FliL protein